MSNKLHRFSKRNDNWGKAYSDLHSKGKENKINLLGGQAMSKLVIKN